MLFSYDCSLKPSFSFCLNSTAEPYKIIAKLGKFFMSHLLYTVYNSIQRVGGEGNLPLK